MKKKQRQDFTHLLIKAFREQYGFTQQELCRLLGIGREQLAMAEAVLRPFPKTGATEFMALKQKLDTERTVGTERDWAEFDREPLRIFWWQCQQQLIEMEYQLIELNKELSQMEQQEAAQRKVIERWDNIPEEVRAAIADEYTIKNIYSRCFSKLARCGTAARLEKQLQIKIFLARIDVLKAFVADNHRA
ncbi:hypothetical protein [Ferruginibacter sp. HRS2-29]|uniref:hypothetical protein n=1 Tax=Ferruginibacter sp. HRS2-29 TaxID=2487334 RepID=UPI0020CBCFE3|nr:hypothetical protein [Ferruginibacter sp. HRS2-29]MCP9751793.1 hypothetical protein [Ferruginibacter sp. HRS2-29]